MKKMRGLNIAHRGFSGQYLENTMEAFRGAMEAGSDGIELDVQLTQDGEVVIFHDSTLDRLTNTEGWIAEWTSEELKHVRMPIETEQGRELRQIPMLSEYFEWAQQHSFFTNIEIKSITSEDRGLERKVLDLIYAYDMKDKVMFSSFHKNSLLRLKEMDAEIDCGLLTPGCNRKILQLTKALGMEYIHPHYTSLTPKLVREAKKLGLGINAWTVNDEVNIQRLEEWQIDGIITDRPDILHDIQQLDRVYA